MKIYILYENPYDEGDNVFGAFSTRRKANKAHKIFSEVSEHELYIREVELDELEQYYPAVKTGLRWFHGYRTRHNWGGSVVYGEWGMSQSGLDSLFGKQRESDVLERDTHVWASIKAPSVEKAKEIADKILEEKGDGYMSWFKEDE